MIFELNYINIIKLKPLDVETDNAMVYLKKDNDQWMIIWGPGTGANPEDSELKDFPTKLL